MERRTADVQGQTTDGDELEPLGAVGEKIAGPQVPVVYVILQRGKGLDPTDREPEGRSASWRAGFVRRIWGQTGEVCDSQIRIRPPDILVPRLPRSKGRLLSTTAREEGNEMDIISKNMGQASVAITADIYAHLTSNVMEEAVENETKATK